MALRQGLLLSSLKEEALLMLKAGLCVEEQGASLADRDSRALESVSNRVELVKMVEDARVKGAMEAIGLHDQGGVLDLQLPLGAEAMISRPGILAVHNLVDINCKILRDMESQLIIRAGFIAGVFHTWRFQANLMKTGRQFEEHFHDIQDQWTAELDAHRQRFDDQLAEAAEKAAAHKEHVRQQHDLLLRQWQMGDAKGLFSSIYKAWAQYVAKEKMRRRSAANIHKVCYEWVEGKNKGLKHSCFAAWFHEHLAGSLARRREEELEKAGPCTGYWDLRAGTNRVADVADLPLPSSPASDALWFN
ncbi:unnamed protein product [Symbiodinium natans]|uniref:Uncharacterized protein n=1 Tax=Symbiodinium natans TaxID=878477 RepID=A0A812R604_9DINO|nr:unnamed protein product [Symbiodinium natans]